MTSQEDKQQQTQIDMDAATARNKAALEGGQPVEVATGSRRTQAAQEAPERRRSLRSSPSLQPPRRAS